MKDEWERVRLLPDLTQAEIDRMADAYFSGKKVVTAERLSGGFSNNNYRIHVEGTDKPFVLRVYGHSEDVGEKELAIHELVQNTVPVPTIYHLDASGVVHDQPFAIVEWVEGVPLREVMAMGNETDLSEAGRAAGAVLADIHRYPFDVPGFFGNGLKVENPLQMDEDLFLSFMRESLFDGKAGEWLGDELTNQVWAFSQEYAPLLAETPGPFSLTHSDFNPWNLLMRREQGKWETAAVLDWEFAFSATATVDIGNMLRYEEKNSVFEQHFIEGFLANGGRMPADWRRQAKLEDLIALCDLLSRTETGKNRVADLKRLIVETITDFDS